MLDNKTNEFLEKNIMRLMMENIEWMEKEMNHTIAKNSYSLTPAETKLFNTLRGRNRSISELSRVMGLSRQAVHKTTHRLIENGYLELAVSNVNKRDRLVCITPEGLKVRQFGASILKEIEKKLSKSIGKENLELIRDSLTKHLDKERASLKA